MLPKDNVYGPWPLSGKHLKQILRPHLLNPLSFSGEIDIVESRGNGLKYTAR